MCVIEAEFVLQVVNVRFRPLDGYCRTRTHLNGVQSPPQVTVEGH